MKKIRFTKMHGIGNDYVYIDTFKESEPDCGWPELAKRLSHRHFGVGSDGLILVCPPQDPTKAQGRMIMYNADGTNSEMCGNGLRCVARFLHDRYLNKANEMQIETGAGILTVKVKERDEAGLASLLEVNMGVPVLKSALIPSTGLGGGQEEVMELEGKKYNYTAVSMGNPHCVIFVDDVKNFPVEELGPLIENNTTVFPRRVNVEFVQKISETEFIQRTWERGAGETWACGTGASAVCVAAHLRGMGEKNILVHLLGGDLRLSWQGVGQPVYKTGPATVVFEGELEL